MLKWILIIFIGATALCMGGCQKRLFDSKANLTPYQRYQQLHNQQPVTRGSNWGVSPEELRARLQPLSQ